MKQSGWILTGLLLMILGAFALSIFVLPDIMKEPEIDFEKVKIVRINENQIPLQRINPIQVIRDCDCEDDCICSKAPEVEVIPEKKTFINPRDIEEDELI